MIRHEHVGSVQIQPLQTCNRDLKARKFKTNSRPVNEIPPGSILTIRKQASKVTGDPPRHTKQDKQDNQTKLIRKENESQQHSSVAPVAGSLSISNLLSFMMLVKLSQIS